MIVGQKAIADGAKLTVKPDRNLTTFDFQNDTAFNVGVAMGRDTGFNGSDYIIPPHSVLQGITAPGITQRTMNAQYWGGTIYLYGQNPPGGTTPTNAPANAFTIIGYAQGAQPAGGFGINRLQNIGNPVSTNMGGSTNLQNDNNPVSTQFIEATQSGSSGSNVTVDNSGNMALKQWVASTLTTIFQTIAGAANGASNVKLSDANHQAEVLGNLLVDLALSVTGNTAITGTLASGAITAPSATLNGVGTGLAVTNNETVGGTLTVTGDTALNGAGTSLAVAHDETVGGVLAVTGVSTLASDVAVGGAISFTGNAQPLIMKDEAATPLTVAQFDAVVAKQLNILDGTAGELANIKSNTKVNGTLEATGATTLDTTLSVTGDATFNGAGNGITVAHNALISGNAAVTGTETVSGLLTAAAGLLVGPNNSSTQLEFKDHLGTARNVMGLDSSDNVTISLTAAGDRLLIRDSTGAEIYLDLQANAIIVGDATTKLPVTIHGALSLDEGNITTNDAGTLAAAAVKSNSFRDNTNGNLAMDLSAGTGAASFPQTITLANNKWLQWKDSGAVVRQILDLDASNLTILRGGGTDVEIVDVSGGLLAYFTNNPAAAQIITGQTSGTATLYEYLRGNIKKVVVILNNYKNTALQAIPLPVAFTNACNFQTGEMFGHFDVKLAGVSNVHIATVTSLAAGGGGISDNSFGGDFSFGRIRGGWDTLDLQANTAAANGVLIFEGT